MVLDVSGIGWNNGGGGGGWFYFALSKIYLIFETRKKNEEDLPEIIIIFIIIIGHIDCYRFKLCGHCSFGSTTLEPEQWSIKLDRRPKNQEKKSGDQGWP